MTVVESLTYYKRGNSSKVESSKDNYTMGRGDEVSRDHNTPRMGSGKTPNFWEGKRKTKRKEFMPKITCFLCDGPH